MDCLTFCETWNAAKVFAASFGELTLYPLDSMALFSFFLAAACLSNAVKSVVVIYFSCFNSDFSFSHFL